MHENMSALKYRGVSIVLCGSFAARGTGVSYKIYHFVRKEQYDKILNIETTCQELKKLKYGDKWVF